MPAGAEAAWAVTAAGNYQQYVSQLGLAEIAYEAINTAQFVDEMKTIDAADDTAGNAVADAEEAQSLRRAHGLFRPLGMKNGSEPFINSSDPFYL